ncbi:MAG: uracil-DNA glycosylase family protein [Prevotella sp.]|nr:uracil-DNA glycosylase family protein [Prevotella sp.]
MGETEYHPLQPFLPEGTRLLMLGSFPPARKRWSMDFFYPNFTNDMWRIFGLCFFGDKDRLVDADRKTFRREAIEQLLRERGIGLYDTATAVCRTTGTASDKDLEVVTPTDLDALFARIPQCRSAVTTGQKATDLFCAYYGISQPKVGSSIAFTLTDGRPMRLYRMPSSSRAYPMRVERKADCYRPMFSETVGPL